MTHLPTSPLRPSAFSPRGFLCLPSSLPAPTRRAALSRQTVFPLGQFDEVKDAVRIPSGGVFFCACACGAFLHTARACPHRPGRPRDFAGQPNAQDAEEGVCLAHCVFACRAVECFPVLRVKARKWGVYGVLAFWRLSGGCGRLFWGLWVPTPDCFRDFAARPSALSAPEGL